MKKFAYVLAGVILVFCLAGCGSIKDALTGERQETEERETRETREREEDEDEESEETEERSGIWQIKDRLSGKETEEEQEEEQEQEQEQVQGQEQRSKDGYAEGRMGDIMKTYFFDYTINRAYLCDEFEGYEPEDGNCLLVAEATVKNTFNESIIMFDVDFQVQWNSDGEDDYNFPITDYIGQVSDEQLPEEYELEIDEKRTGLLVFEVPEGRKDFSISYLEMFDDDSEGDVFFVYFTAKKR